MENFLNTLNEKILIIDYTGKILFLNKSLLIQLGYKPNEIINKNILSLTFTKDINAFLLKDTPLKNLYIISKNSFPIEFNINTSRGLYKNTDSIFIKLENYTDNITCDNHKNFIFNNKDNIKKFERIDKSLPLKINYEIDIAKSNVQLNSIDNLLKQNLDCTNEFTFFNELSDAILESLNCDEFHAWIYFNESLIPYCSSSYDELTKNFQSIQLTHYQYETLIKPFTGWGLYDIDSLASNKLHKYYRKTIKQICVQPIFYNNKFLGLIYIGYKDKFTPVVNRNDFISTLCNHFGMSMHNYLLSNNLKIELHKRLKTEKELSFLLRTATDLTATIASNGDFLKINEGWIKLLGYTKEELLSMNLLTLTHSNDKYKLHDLFSGNLDSISTITDLCIRLITKNNCIKWLNWNCSYINSDNVIMFTGKDITDKKELEIEKKLMEESLHVENIKNEFFANISHEFKTPLNIILASLQVINHNIFNKNIKFSKDFNLKKYTNSIKQNSYRLLRLANNLIDITKIDSGYYEIQPKNCNIVSIIEDITISVAQYMKDKGIDLIFDTSFEEIIISCDPDKIERIMLNLLSNAVKYTKSPGIINVFIDKTEDTVIISVKDTGIGIPKENISIIFERFIQVDDTLTRKCEGSGIGLSLVQSLVQMHGGKIAVYSTKDIGSEFTFTLPLQTINNSDIIYNINEDSHSKLDKRNIEFSDIYSLY